MSAVTVYKLFMSNESSLVLVVHFNIHAACEGRLQTASSANVLLEVGCSDQWEHQPGSKHL